MGLLFVFFGVFALVCVELSVPVWVQVIAWKDSSPKWPIMCRGGRKTLYTHSLTHSLIGYTGQPICIGCWKHRNGVQVCRGHVGYFYMSLSLSNKESRLNIYCTIYSCPSTLYSRRGKETMKHGYRLTTAGATVYVMDCKQNRSGCGHGYRIQTDGQATRKETSPEISRLGHCLIFANWGRQIDDDSRSMWPMRHRSLHDKLCKAFPVS